MCWIFLQFIHRCLISLSVINNEFRSKLLTLLGPGHIPSQINDAVTASLDPLIGGDVVTAYVGAFRLGFRILAGIAVLQFAICLGLAKVSLGAVSDPEVS